MPTTVSKLFKNADLSFSGPVPWAQPVSNDNPGVYVVSTTNDPKKHLGIHTKPTISAEIVYKWVHEVTSIELDRVASPNPKDIVNRLAEFWLPDESILYIGMTTAKLEKRINDYYRTPLGAKKPHAGGHWLKTLSNLSSLYVYHASCENPKSKKDQLLGFFVSNISKYTKSLLSDSVHPFPFANLEYPQGNRKKHGIGRSTAS